MGNNQGSHHQHKHHHKEKSNIDPRLENAFKEISGGLDILTFEKFKVFYKLFIFITILI